MDVNYNYKHAMLNFFLNFKKIVALLFLLISFSLQQTGCKKLVEVDAPVTSISAGNVYSNDETATSVLTGIYTTMSVSNSIDFTRPGIQSISLFTGLSADELTLFDLNNDNINNTNFYPYYSNSLTDLNVGIADFWINIYPIIFIANSAIEGLNNNSSLTSSVKQQLLGEAKFIRAFCYFYLVNLYGDVPLVTGTDPNVNASLPRTPQTLVYQQIIADLKDAQNLLSANYLGADVTSTTSERVRPTKWAAMALLARVYLYTKDYVKAEAQATDVINNSSFYGLSALDDVFLKNSTEAIWQLQPVRDGIDANTGEGKLFILPDTGPNSDLYPVYLSNNVVNSFEIGDQRKMSWVDSVIVDNNIYYFPYKYKVGAIEAPVSEYIMVLRLGEQYLIRAEARANQGNISGAVEDLNAIRSRAGLPGTTASDQTALLMAIQHERQVELFTEWGHRWFDLKRTNTVNTVMNSVTPQKGGIWNPNWQLYPISLSELQADPKLVQNPGYN